MQIIHSIQSLSSSEKLEKFRDLEFYDLFPMNNKPCTAQNLLKISGIYFAALLLCLAVLMLLGGIFILGIIVKIIFVPIIVYALVGMIEFAVRFMRLN